MLGKVSFQERRVVFLGNSFVRRMKEHINEAIQHRHYMPSLVSEGEAHKRTCAQTCTPGQTKEAVRPTESFIKNSHVVETKIATESQVMLAGT